MEELKRTLEEVFKNEIIKIVISNKVKKDEKYNKIAINLKENNKNKFYQIEKFTDKQVFHANPANHEHLARPFLHPAYLTHTECIAHALGPYQRESVSHLATAPPRRLS